MLNVAVVLTIILLVVRSRLVLMILILLIVGTLALLYYMTSYYSLRGGASDSGAFCGTFFVHVYVVASYARWFIGAALSFI